MGTDVLFELLTRLAYIIIFVDVLRRAIRQPYRSNVEIALFFGALAFAVTIGWATNLLGIEQPRWLEVGVRTLLVALPYLLLRVVAEFSDVPRWLMRTGLLAAALGIGAVFAWDDLPTAAVAFIVAYFVVFMGYTAGKFLRESRSAHGVTRRRMQFAAGGTAIFSAIILIAGMQAVWDLPEAWTAVALQLGLLGAGAAYLAGFAPPVLLRRAWQQPELRVFLRRVSELPWLEDTTAIIRRLEEGAASAFGAERATISLWDPEGGTLHVLQDGEGPVRRGGEVRPGEFIVGRAFEAGRPIFTPDAAKEDPMNADVYAEWNARAILAAPINAGGARLGILAVYGRRTPVFAADDLGLVEVLADQAAMVLESRRLLEEATAVRAREEATRLRDDFLSAAAHDLRTPLTSILGSAQLLERKAAARADDSIDVAGLRRISREATRLQTLVSRLLDAGRAETGRLVSEQRERSELTDLARGVLERQATELHPCDLEGDLPVFADVDRVRFEQLLENLIENGKKYSPDGGTITVRIWQEAGANGGRARVAVRDRGIGIPPGEHAHVFERFRRAANVDDRRFSGMGLGLYICRVITEQHDGRIWVESRVGEGSTFHIELPHSGAPPPGELEK